jgi:hypothetical protein
MEFILTLLAATSILWGALFRDSDAADFQRTTLSYLAGDGYVTGEHQRNIVSIDTIKVGSTGLLYENVDLQSFTGHEAYNVSRVVGHLGTGLHLAGQDQNAQGYSNTNVGMGYDLFTSNGFVGTDVYYRTDNLMGDGVYVFGFARTNFGNNLIFDGFIDVSAPNKPNKVEVQWLAHPSIMCNFNKSFSTGIEQQLYLNKGYVKGRDESVPQLKIMYGW